jgi:large subunit ribosomal protein L5
MSKKTSRLKEKYEKEVIPTLMKELKINNSLAVPRLDKVVVNMGMGDAVKDKGMQQQAKSDMAAVTGQVPSVRPAKVSVASFGIRRGMPVGLTCTLRGNRMYDFFDKLVSIVLPRLRDFRGVSLDSFDKFGNYSIGIPEHIVFPEVDLAKSKSKSLEVTIVTSTQDNKKAKKLLSMLGMPFRKTDDKGK